jgi:hypothetical protein
MSIVILVTQMPVHHCCLLYHSAADLIQSMWSNLPWRYVRRNDVIYKFVRFPHSISFQAVPAVAKAPWERYFSNTE